MTTAIFILTILCCTGFVRTENGKETPEDCKRKYGNCYLNDAELTEYINATIFNYRGITNGWNQRCVTESNWNEVQATLTDYKMKCISCEQVLKNASRVKKGEIEDHRVDTAIHNCQVYKSRMDTSNALKQFQRETAKCLEQSGGKKFYDLQKESCVPCQDFSDLSPFCIVYQHYHRLQTAIYASLVGLTSVCIFCGMAYILQKGEISALKKKIKQKPKETLLHEE